MPTYHVTVKSTKVYSIDAEDKDAALEAVREKSAELIGEEEETMNLTQADVAEVQ